MVAATNSLHVNIVCIFLILFDSVILFENHLFSEILFENGGIWLYAQIRGHFQLLTQW